MRATNQCYQYINQLQIHDFLISKKERNYIVNNSAFSILSAINEP